MPTFFDPESIESKIQRLEQAQKRLRTELRREPMTLELCEALQLDPVVVIGLLKLQKFKLLSQ